MYVQHYSSVHLITETGLQVNQVWHSKNYGWWLSAMPLLLCNTFSTGMARFPLLATIWTLPCYPLSGLSRFTHSVISHARLWCYDFIEGQPLGGRSGYILVWAEASLALAHFTLTGFFLPEVHYTRTPGPQLFPLWALGTMAPGLTSCYSWLVPPVFATRYSILQQATVLLLKCLGFCPHAIHQASGPWSGPC